MRIVRVWMTNWLRFVGDNTVDLEPTVYGITAQYDGDDRRSNWAGKTGFIEAIRFALYGEHRSLTEDGWISHGEPGGSVSVTLSDGTLVTRSRKRGHATKLLVLRGTEEATGKAAQGVLNELLGLNVDDFEVTCWFGQKQMAKIIMARPVERFELVSSWVGLGPLQRCEERVRETLTDLAKRQERVRQERALVEASLEGLWRQQPLLAGVSQGGAWAVLQQEQARLGGVVEAAAQRRQQCELALRELAASKEAAVARRDLEAVRSRGRLLNLQIEQGHVDVRGLEAVKARHDQAKRALTLSGEDLKAKRSLAQGRFSGCCPVDGATCPVRDEINARVGENVELYREAQHAFDKATQDEGTARLELNALYDAQVKQQARVALRDDLRDQAAELVKVAAPPGLLVDEGAHDRAVGALGQASQELAEAREALRVVGLALGELVTLQDRLGYVKLDEEGLARDAQVRRAALRIFGRQGAQKRIAEEALAEVERGANQILREAAVDLSLQVRWAREGQGLAAWCPECAAPFPQSAKVKTCAACGAERGLKVVERLDVELSDRSGAAEDLAGAALQLSAAAWLRRERGAAWSVAFLDEPFGALDEALRRSFAAHLTSMLRGAAAFEQAFIIAHHPDVLDGLPGRLLVRAGAVASTVEVV